MNDKLFMSREELAKQLGISIRTIKVWTNKGGLPCYRPTRTRVVYNIEDVKNWMVNRTKQFDKH